MLARLCGVVIVVAVGSSTGVAHALLSGGRATGVRSRNDGRARPTSAFLDDAAGASAPFGASRETTRLGAVALRGGASTMPPGLTSAVLSPVASALGFTFWDDNWRGGSAFALNLVKNTVAGAIFFFALAARGAVPDLRAVGLPTWWSLALSALLGVVVGDCAAIASLRRLGARRYLLVDCLRTALSVPVGALLFGERGLVNARGAVGVFAVLAGVYAASSARDDGADDGADGNDLVAGYAYGLVHMVFDTIGAAITKGCLASPTTTTTTTTTALGPLAVGWIRFGSAALMLHAARFAATAYHGLTIRTTTTTTTSDADEPRWWSVPGVVDDARKAATTNAMTRANYRAIVVGTVFVTVLGPALFYRSLQHMSLGLGVTLSCTAPLYAPFLARALKGTPIDARSVLGAGLAVLGVAVLSLTT